MGRRDRNGKGSDGGWRIKGKPAGMKMGLGKEAKKRKLHAHASMNMYVRVHIGNYF